MKGMIYSVLQHWTQGGVAGLLSGAGMGLVVFAGMAVMVEEFLDMATGMIGGLPSDILSIVLLAGLDTGLSMIGSAVLTRLAFKQAAVSFGMIPKGPA